MATVIMSAPDASIDSTISSLERCRPVPTISLESNSLPAMTSLSSIAALLVNKTKRRRYIPAASIEFIMSLRWHYPDQVIAVGEDFHPPSQPDFPELPTTHL